MFTNPKGTLQAIVYALHPFCSLSLFFMFPYVCQFTCSKTLNPAKQSIIKKPIFQVIETLTSVSLPYKVEKIDITKNTQKEDWVSITYPESQMPRCNSPNILSFLF